LLYIYNSVLDKKNSFKRQQKKGPLPRYVRIRTFYSYTNAFVSGIFVLLSSSKSIAKENQKYIGKVAEVICYNEAGWYDVRVEGKVVKWRGKKNMPAVKK
jgi:hypothetical protein